MANAWVEFVRKYSKDHNISYGCAVSKPECKSQYHAGKKNAMAEKQQEKTPSLLSSKKTSQMREALSNMKRTKIVPPANFGIPPVQTLLPPTPPTAPQGTTKPKSKKGRKPKPLRRQFIVLDE